MRKPKIILALLVSYLYGSSFVHANAESWDSFNRKEQHREGFTANSPMEVIVSKAVYFPGDKIPSHIHHGFEAAYVISGARVQAPNKAPITIQTGSSVLHKRGLLHGGFTVIGTEPLELFTVHIVDKNSKLFDTSDKVK